MPAYELGRDANNFQAYLVHSEDLQLLAEFYGQPQAGRWRPVRLTAYRERKRRDPQGDFPSILTGDTVLSQRAVDALRDLLEPVGDILPVQCDDEPLWFYNCTRFADVLDEEASVFSRFPSTGRIMTIYRHAWRPEVDQETLFRIPQLRNSPIYITDVVVERIRSAGLRGYKLGE